MQVHIIVCTLNLFASFVLPDYPPNASFMLPDTKRGEHTYPVEHVRMLNASH